MQQVPQSAQASQRAQQRIVEVAGRALSHEWAKVGDDFTPGWERIRPGVNKLFRVGLAAATANAAGYTPALLAETGVAAPGTGDLNISMFSEFAPDGTDPDTFFDAAPIRAKQAVSRGASALEARQVAGAWLTSQMLTALADTRRNVISVDTARRPQLTGYVRMLNGGSCPRCAILAGKWFRWNEGFQRHPNCDCVHIPAPDQGWAEAEGFVADPYEYFDSLTEEEQDKLFRPNLGRSAAARERAAEMGRRNAQAIRDGADIYRIENIRFRGLGTSRQAYRYGTPTRMTPNDIYDLGLSRTDTIRRLESEGYITGPQTPGGNIVGPRREAYQQPISRAVVPGSKRDRVLRARETGVRDPLDRATMTAAERRLFDAVYRREYARKYGYLPRTIGQNSADQYSGLTGLPATPQRLALLDAEISSYVSKIRPNQRSMIRLADELGLNGDEFQTGQAFRKIEGRIGTAAVQNAKTATGGGGAKKPPAPPRRIGSPGPLEPDDRAKQHITDGDNRGGGHKFGAKVPGKTQFPESWSDDVIFAAVLAVQASGKERESRGALTYEALYQGVLVRVVVNRGRVTTAYPLRGPGIMRDGVDMPLQSDDSRRYDEVYESP